MALPIYPTTILYGVVKWHVHGPFPVPIPVGPLIRPFMPLPWPSWPSTLGWDSAPSNRRPMGPGWYFVPRSSKTLSFPNSSNPKSMPFAPSLIWPIINPWGTWAMCRLNTLPMPIRWPRQRPSRPDKPYALATVRGPMINGYNIMDSSNPIIHMMSIFYHHYANGLWPTWKQLPVGPWQRVGYKPWNERGCWDMQIPMTMVVTVMTKSKPLMKTRPTPMEGSW
mmetsp:Transcript_25974/g.49273  ORF Transcript_25974/g.49273 Transcript_25974/m.49273 type:complete len:223 (-) Transcript_25974:412-1080(-)